MDTTTTIVSRRSRITQYTVLAGAAASVAAAPSAQAAVVYSGLVNLPIPNTFGGIYLDMTTGVTAGAAFVGWDINPYNAATSMYCSAASGGTNPLVSVIAAAGIVDANLAPGIAIPGVLVLENGLARDTNLAPGQTGIMGIQFVDAGNTYNGWVRMTRGAGGDGSLVDFAWDNTPNTPIAAGAGIVPEPGSLGLLALGAAGLSSWRRRKAV